MLLDSSNLVSDKLGTVHGYSKKTVKSAVGSFELETPRDRNGEFEPVLVKTASD